MHDEELADAAAANPFRLPSFTQELVSCAAYEPAATNPTPSSFFHTCGGEEPSDFRHFRAQMHMSTGRSTNGVMIRACLLE